MLTAHKQKILTELISSSQKDELIWINGYISSLIINGGYSSAFDQTEPNTNRNPIKITIAYGTETGNSKRVATELVLKAKKKKLLVKLASLDQYRLTDITKEENLLVVISTQGDGEPPIAARKFYDHIHQNGFRLDNLKYSVLALGDTSYPMFCKTGEDVDLQLQKLGGTCIVPIKKCDVDYESDAAVWFDEVMLSIEELPGTIPLVLQIPNSIETKSNKKIYTGTVLVNINLKDRGSNGETHHLELSTQYVDYLPGDSIGVVPENSLELVNMIMSKVGIPNEKIIHHKGNDYTVLELLTKKLNIVYLHERVVKKYAEIAKYEIPETKMDLLSLLSLYPLKDTNQFIEILQILSTQAPRIYTISSSPAAHDGEIHLTIEKDTFTINQQLKIGLCSEYVNSFLIGDSFDFFIQKNKRFRLPAENKDVLMIGPGTGIAAFRSFLSERDATGASGKNWLFFGEEHFVSDFLYQTEIQDWFQKGVLNKVTLAFSKDQPEQIFAQDKIKIHGMEIYAWIKSGAYVYVCGEKAPMGVAVENELVSIFQQYGQLSLEDAKKYFNQMKDEGRYAKELY